MTLRAVFFGETPDRIAGSQKSLLTAVLHARRFGLEPVMVFPGEGQFERRCRAEGLRVRILPGPPSFNVFGKALLRMPLAGQVGVVARELLPYARSFARLLDEERAEIAHFNNERGMILAGMGAHLGGRSAVMHQRGAVAIGRLYKLVAQSLADWILCVARALVTEILPARRPRTSVLYNGVNADLPVIERAAARARVAPVWAGEIEIREDVPLFVSLSSPAAFKGLHYLLDAAAIARDRGVRAAYVLAGATVPGSAGGYSKWLAKKRDALGLRGTVALAGFVEDTHALLCAGDALVLPSVEHERIEDGDQVYEARSNEGLPRSILEAMVAGIPSIASDIAGVSEQIEDGRNGLLVPPKDPVRLADAIERLARDRDLRERSGAAARGVAQARFRIEDAARGLLDALSMVAAEPRGLGRKALDWPSMARDAFGGRVG